MPDDWPDRLAWQELAETRVEWMESGGCTEEGGGVVFGAGLVWKRREVWRGLREGMGTEGRVSLIIQHCCHCNTTKPSH